MLAVEIELLLVSYELRDIPSHELGEGICCFLLHEFFLDLLESNSSDLLYKVVKILKQRFIHYYQQQNCMHYRIVYLTLLFVSISSTCLVNQTNSLPSDYQEYLTAGPINTTQQITIIQLYQNLTKLSSYYIDISSSHYIYVNNYPQCIKNTTKVTFNALYDIWLCLDDYYLLECNQQWQLLIECGTYLEIHRPFDATVLMRFNVQDIYWAQDINGVLVSNLLLNKLCAGMYHIWFVYYSRQGKFIKRVRTIYFSYPSCKC